MAIFLIRDPRCVFIHIPKTGGASIRRGVFEENYEGPVFRDLPEEWQDAFCFGFVRNPFDRLASAYRMFTGGMHDTASRYRAGESSDLHMRPLSFREFLDIVLDESIIFDERRATYEERVRHHTIPQTHEFHGLQHAARVGRFERFADDFREIAERLGLASGNLPHLNRTASRDYRRYYDPETRSLAEAFYAEDLKQLGYQF